MTKIFFSYSHADESLRDQLEKHLSLLKRQGLISSWHDRRIMAGEELATTIDQNLEEAEVVLLLVSADFLHSEYCYSKEMLRAIERHDQGLAKVIPVILRNCDWHSAPFGKLLAAPTDGKAITSWANQDEAFTDVAQQIRAIVEKRSQAENKISSQRIAPHMEPVRTESSNFEIPRSSNLRVKKEFSDLEQHRFLQEGFEFMARFFSSSLEALESRNSNIQCRFLRIDAQQFSAVIYKNEKIASECLIRIDSSFGGRDRNITFSYDASARAGSSNEMISVDHDTQAMFFKTLGMQSFNRESRAQLTPQGASELLWGLVMDRLQ